MIKVERMNYEKNEQEVELEVVILLLLINVTKLG
jgi:hypothetical protein